MEIGLCLVGGFVLMILIDTIFKHNGTEPKKESQKSDNEFVAAEEVEGGDFQKYPSLTDSHANEEKLDITQQMPSLLRKISHTIENRKPGQDVGEVTEEITKMIEKMNSM